MATPHPAFLRALLAIALLLLAPQSVGAPTDSALASGRASVVGQAKVNTGALYAAHTARRPVTLERVPLAEFGEVRLELEPFAVVNEDTLMLAADGARRDRPIDFDPSSVATFRGDVAGLPGSSVYLALAPHHGGTGVITLADGRVFRFSPNTAAAARAGELVLDVFSPHGLGDLDQAPFCALDPPPAPARARGTGTYEPYTPVDPSSPMLDIEMAFDCDYEYFSMFPNEQVTLEFLVMLWGEVSAIYQRDVRARVRVVFVRIWTTEDDPYNMSSPLSAVSQVLNGEFQDLQKDAITLLSGRRNLPYGGVAYLGRRCSDMDWLATKVSVNGYQTPTFPAPETPSMYGYNLGVICHELGHNCNARHTHNYGYDQCNLRAPARGTIMSYCASNGGGGGNRELRFDARIARVMRNFLEPDDPCVATDVDGDTVPDEDQILADPSLDTDLNGVLDAYEDRNNNGVPDGVDIDNALETDVDGNRVPDRFEPDCNGNGLPDHYEIASGMVEDRTYNGVPDGCETDCNADGIADVNQFHEVLALDLDRNNALDECQDCDADGVQDFEQLGASGWAYVADGEKVVGVNAAGIAVAQSGPIATTRLAVHPDGRIVTHDAGSDELVVLAPDLSETARFAFGMESRARILEVEFNGPRLYIAQTGPGTVRVDVYPTLDATAGETVLSGSAPFVGDFEAFSLADDGTPDFFLAGTPAASGGEPEIHRFDGATGAWIERVVALEGPSAEFEFVDIQAFSRGRFFVHARDTPDAEVPPMLFEIRADGSLRQAPVVGGSSSSSSDWGLNAEFTMTTSPDGRLALVTPDLRVLYREYDPATFELLYRGAYHIFEQSTEMPDLETIDLQRAFDVAFAPGAPDDCNRNGIPDSCDIVEGRESDTNTDGVPDSCAPTRCVADTNSDGSLTPADLTAWLVAYRAGDMIADSSLDGFVRSDDFSAWIVAYQNGCD